ncbi:putative Ig domain-containing protein [Streptacidiphilus anmyonensis]|uniref:putative Ig domain-containing protein n=1 Tax=Streptacidiphilus anmyonensis TaxID=405782 RepID=UPI0005A9FD5A|nr:putative Ig domain-containing protein [Streptacidiphilus anmyonensis]
MGVSVVFENGSDPVEVVPGEQAECVLRVENTGMVVDRVLLDVLGDAAEWARVEPASINLLPNARASVRVVFQPPRASSLAPGEVRFGLRAMSTEDPEGSCIEEGSLRVGEFADLGARLVPRSATGRRSARFRLVVENRGNRPEQVRVEAHDPEVKLGFRTRPPVFVARPGTATFVRLRTVPRKTFFKGPNRTLPFEVKAVPEGGEPAKAEGAMLEKQTLPEWLLPTLGIAAVALGLLATLWFSVLQPVVHSAASAASQAQNAANSAQSAQAAAAKAKANAKPGTATALDVKLASATVVAGRTERATATGTFAGGAGTLPALVWTSSAPKIASVSPTGVVTALTPGSATITATGATSAKTAPAPTQAAATDPATAQPAPGSGTAPGGAAASPGAKPAGPPILSGSVTVDVVGPAAVSSATVPDASLGKPYSQSLTASGGTGAYTWQVSSGALPAGLTLSPDSGVISGTPTTAGTASFSLRLTDAGPPTEFAVKKLQLTVVNAVLVGNSGLPEATLGTAYSRTLTAVGCTASCTWSLAPGQGALPDGLSLTAAGVLSGKATQTGTFPFTLLATDPAMPSQPGTQHLSLTVVDPLAVNAQAPLPDAVAGTSYAQTLKATGGTQPYTWTPATPLPKGWTLDPASGVLTTTPGPRLTGSSTITVRLTDSGQPALTASHSYTVRVVAPLATTTSSLPQAVYGQPYQMPVQTTGGVGPYVLTETGALPTDMKFDQNTFHGTPTEAGTFPLTVETTDAGTPSQTSIQHLVLTVVRPLQVSTLTLPGAVTGTPYSQALRATGGTGPYTWSAVGSLPSGISLDPTSGVLSGTPDAKAMDASTFTVQVTDSGQPALTTAPQTFTLTVVPPLVDTTADAPQGIYGKPYDALPQQPAGLQLTASGGTGPHYVFSRTDSPLPPGLSLQGDRITGQPTATGTFAFSVQVTDASSPPLTITESLSITVVGSLTISPDPVPDAVTGKPYTHKVTAIGGTAPYTWSWAPATPDGKLPDGLSLNSVTGLISGTPTTAGVDPVVITVSDSGGPVQSTTWPVTLTVDKPLSISYQTPSPEIQGQFYSLVPTASSDGAGLGDTWAMTGGVLPAGLSLDPTTGFITGTVTAAPGTYAFTVTVSDSAGHTALASTGISLVVIKPLTVPTPYTWTGTVGTRFDATVTPSGGEGPFTFTFTPKADSSLTDVTLDSTTGVLSGTPDGPCVPSSTGAPSGSATGSRQTVLGTCQPDVLDGQVTVTDALGEVAVAQLTLTASVPPLVVTYTPSPTPTQTAGAPFRFDMAADATGGYPSGTVTYSATGLPCGANGCDTIDPATGIVTGHVDGLGQGTVTFTVTVTSTDPHNSLDKVTAEYQATIDTAPAATASQTPGAPN